MKKFGFLLVFAFVVFGCCACSVNVTINPDSSSNSAASVVEQEPAEERTATSTPGKPKSDAFYGVWCLGSKQEADAEAFASKLIKQGFDAQVFVTTDWKNLNSERYYVVTAGVCQTKQEAEQLLSRVKDLGYSDAYVKYSGERKAPGTSTPSNPKADAFYGVWCLGSKQEADAETFASKLIKQGFDAQVFVTTDWKNLNSERYYVVTAGVCQTKQEAEQLLSRVKDLGYSDAYIKYTGERK